jgi:very-short-patch-repair endonuclease/Cdc6-like AAA superfamily ATPase
MSEDTTREQSVRLFKFLRELTVLRTKTVRTLEKYDKVVWFEDVPERNECFSVYRTSVDDRSELWLEVEQPNISPCPKPSEELAPWLHQEDLYDLDLEFPPLQKTIAVERTIATDLLNSASESVESDHAKQLKIGEADSSVEPDRQLKIGSVDSTPSSTGDALKSRKLRFTAKKAQKITELVKLSDHPEIQEEWEKYVERTWKPWAETARPFLPVRRLYDQLFEIHHALEKEAESFELLLGVGCLAWLTPSKQKVLRHVLTARATLEFDAVRGVISVKAPLEGAKFVLEQDMLEQLERPQGQQRKAVETLVEELGEDFWAEQKTADLLELYSHAISSRGSFSSTLKAPIEYSSEPVISLSPAILFRPRTDLHFVRLFDEIVTQIEEGQDIPLGVERLVQILDDEDNSMDESTDNLSDEEIYFPLPANPDQREIAQRLRTRQGILVQGPPGTGKSHTIANLVCHLLASGKRILVTSHTPRALTVLRDKFPEDMKALCVSVVGDDNSDSRKALEDSVAGITAKHNSWNPARTTSKISDLRQQLDELRRAEQWALNALRSIKECDTFNHPSKFSSYSGTAQSIAQQLQPQTEKLGWLPSSPNEKEEAPLSNSEMLRLLELLRLFDEERESKVTKQTLQSSDLIEPAKLTELAAKQRNAMEWSQKIEALKEHDSFLASAKLKAIDRNRIVHMLDELIALFNRIRKRPEEFSSLAAREIIGDHDRKWRELLEVTRNYLDKIGDGYRAISQTTVSGVEGRDLHTVRVQALDLKKHFVGGGGMGFGPFKPKALKQGSYLVSAVRVDGHLCNNLETIDQLLAYLDLEISVQVLRRNWDGISKTIPSSLIAAVASFHDYCEPLDDCLRLYEKMHQLRGVLDSFPALGAPKWDDIQSIKEFRDVVASGAAEEELLAFKQTLQDFETRLRAASTSPKAHPVLFGLLEALTNLDDEQYHSSYEINEKLLADKKALDERNSLLNSLRANTPEIADDLVTTCSESSWESRCGNFVESWNWARASRWLAELSNPLTFKRYSADLSRSQNEIRDTLRELAALKAWEHTFARLTEGQRQHLISWSMAVKRVGKGTGKYAEKHRRDARMHMDKCRSAIPAWIMPIHKVVESVRPGTDAFDVIIVDEASQSGPEALFLLYLAKQIIVVGDDKQISPDFIGLDRSSVDALREQFLKGIPHSDAIGLDHSFFDQAKIRYRGKIRLKEHFRCMPEIIQFSNNLCYSSEPLIPLRQYGGGRVTPVVKTVHVATGYVDENSSKPVNIPEAEALCLEVKRICSDSAYAGKTIGIISLLNTSGQAKYIEQQLRNSEKYISKAEYESRHLRVGDSYMFQGDERDIILLSMVSAPLPNKRLSAITADKDDRKYNVAVSRARDQLVLFHSVTLSDLNPKCIRSRLLSYCLSPQVETAGAAGHEMVELKRMLIDGYATQSSPPKPFDSWFELDVFIRLADRGYRVIPQVEMNGYSIDLIVEGLRGRLAVECDGDRWHGPDKYDSDMARQRDLERCGMQFWRLRGSSFYHSPESALDELWQVLDRMKIYPTMDSDLAEGDLDLSSAIPELYSERYVADSSESLMVAESIE